MNKTNAPLPDGTEFFSWGDGTWGDVHRLEYVAYGTAVAAKCSIMWPSGHVTERTTEDWAKKPCRECSA